jgi:hypothetical protein
LGCSISHSRRKEKGREYLEDALVKGWAPSRRRQGRKSKGGGSERRERFNKQREEMNLRA